MSYCIIIPNYNHTHLLDEYISRLATFNLPVLMVNDGSSSEACQLFARLESKYPYLSVVSHKQNMGKGAAVKTGLRQAFQLGYSHAIQVDADGQHDLNDIDKIRQESLANPLALISGQPTYNESVPKHRYLARYLTHFWVWVETLSLTIKDSMCGFRAYPLSSMVKLIDNNRLGDRMDFDIEVLVKSYWNDVEIRFFATAVDYPENGISHFRAFEDNVLISWMHTRLFFGMLLRSPKLFVKTLTNK